MTASPSVTGERDASAIITAGAALATPRSITGYKPFAVVPQGMALQPLERETEIPRPEHVKASPEFYEVDSLVGYFNRFKDKDSLVMADVDANRMLAVIDYHQQATGSIHGSARFTDHRATLNVRHSPEWNLWNAAHGKTMNQKQFAEFIEDNAADIKSPTAQDLYAMALTFEAVKSGNFNSAIRLESGSISVGFKEDTVGAAKNLKGDRIDIPRDFEVLLAVYQGGQKGSVTARLRYRVEEGNLSLCFHLMQRDQIKRAAFESMIEKVEADAATKVLRTKLT
jgi:uncharacterized protein YfdQ (DUF2303 family)